jgi:hypothetical protein
VHFFVDINYFKQYGIGLFLYFDFLKKMIILLFVMGLIGLVAAFYNIRENGLAKYGQLRSNFLLMSLANQP